ncbi:MAG: sigma-70 family RNA polymerase sigma factor [Pseudomonadota bacterium]
MFSEKLEALLPELRAYAVLLCKDATRADDLVQNTCLKAWQSRADYDPEKGALRGWLFRILRNDFYQQCRSDTRSETRETEELEPHLIADCGLEPRSNLSRMLKAVDSLKRVQRDAFLLVVAAGFTYEEAAEVFDCSPGTVKSRVSRAREIALGRFHSEHWLPNATHAIGSPLDDLHLALDGIERRYSAA